MPRTTAHKLAWPRKWQLRRCVRGMALPCGCLVGVYETYDGGTVTVVDVPGSSCTAAGHLVNAVLDEDPDLGGYA